MALLHPQLAQDCLLIGKLPLCTLLLMNDTNYPWFILVLDRESVTEIFQLSIDDQTQLIKESSIISNYLNTEFKADKINIAALGNIVPQLHVHHIARYKNDIAWPTPVWGKEPTKAYTDADLEKLFSKLKSNPIIGLAYSI